MKRNLKVGCLTKSDTISDTESYFWWDKWETSRCDNSVLNWSQLKYLKLVTKNSLENVFKMILLSSASQYLPILNLKLKHINLRLQILWCLRVSACFIISTSFFFFFFIDSYFSVAIFLTLARKLIKQIRQLGNPWILVYFHRIFVKKWPKILSQLPKWAILIAIQS